MGYIKEKVTERVTHEKSTGMICDRCGCKTDKPDDRSWHGFFARSYYFNDDENDTEYYTVCSPECYILFIQNFIKECDEGSGTEIDDMELEFAEKWERIKHNSETALNRL